MRTAAIILFIFCGFSLLHGQKAPGSSSGRVHRADTLELNEAEIELARQINDYRKSKDLKPIPLSASLSLVARIHVYDLSENYVYGRNCNLHSWSSSGYWSSCCYTSDHRRAACMWDKPRELTDYKGDGYEIAFYSTYEYSSVAGQIADAIGGWKTSRGHNELIVNKGKWTTSEWKAMGVGVYGGFVVVWFGEHVDQAGGPIIRTN
jgi:hypothetical protein